jgi:hypothetical protein
MRGCNTVTSPWLSALLFVLTQITAASAQGPPPQRPGPMTPSEPHERMTFFEGTWTTDGKPDAANGSPAPAGYEETCAWLPGARRHMVCRSWTEMSPGAPRREALYVLSYRAADSTYIAHFAFSGGATLTYYGRPDGERWIMNLQPTPLLPSNQRLRTIITAEPEGLRFVEESSVDGGPWEVTEDYRRRRVR